MTTNLKEDALFIKSYQTTSHAAENPIVKRTFNSYSRLHCPFKEQTATQLQQPLA